MKPVTRAPVEFYASTEGFEEVEVLARFTRDTRGLHVERLDRNEGRWVLDSDLAGYSVGFDDWAEQVTREEAAAIVLGWGLDRALLDAPLSASARA